MGEARRRKAAGTYPAPAVYHYTSLLHLPHILADGHLRPARPQEGHDRGILWISRERHWEPASARQGNTARQMPARFRLPLCGDNWMRVSHAAGASDDWIVSIAVEGQRIGSNPDSWLATLEPIQVDASMLEWPVVPEGVDPSRAPLALLSWQPAGSVTTNIVNLTAEEQQRVLDSVRGARTGVCTRNAALMQSDAELVARTLELDGVVGLVSVQVRYSNGYHVYAMGGSI